MLRLLEHQKIKTLKTFVFKVFGAEGGILRRLLGCTRRSAPLPPRVCSPVATKTVPRTVFARPSNPFTTKQKTIRLDGFLFWRRGRDSPQTSQLHTALRTSSAARLLPCGYKNSPPDCFCAPFESPRMPKEKGHIPCPFIFWRRGRDSNPRVVSHKLISSGCLTLEIS